MYWCDESPRYDREELKQRIKLFDGDAPREIDLDATPFVVSLCREFQVGVSSHLIGNSPYKVANTIFLDFTVVPERQNWAFCHELAHLLLGHDNLTTPSLAEENATNHLAAELLLPREQFGLIANQPLSQLKNEFPHASWEAILRRKLQFVSGIGTIFDEGKMTFRSASPGLSCPHQPLPDEWQTARDAFNQAQSLQRLYNALKVNADYVDTGNGIRRVLLWTESLEQWD